MAKHQVAQIRDALLTRIFWEPSSPVPAVSEEFGVTRQAAQRHMQALASEGLIVTSGANRYRRFRLAQRRHSAKTYSLGRGFTEDAAWGDFGPRFADMGVGPAESEICQYGLTEMVNNVIDHAEARRVEVAVGQTAKSAQLIVKDHGVGIFKKVAASLGLPDPREALLELSKGKFTTDPRRHTGEGLFFTARMFDRFAVLSGSIRFVHVHGQDAWFSEDLTPRVNGTVVLMELLLPSSRRMQDVFSRFSSGPEDYRFAKTHVPLRLAAFGDESLISRSSARRVISRAERFDEVVLDFTGVRSIGQAFADEIFRVFHVEHPDVELKPVNANRQVLAMISRARSHGLK